MNRSLFLKAQELCKQDNPAAVASQSCLEATDPRTLVIRFRCDYEYLNPDCPLVHSINNSITPSIAQSWIRFWEDMQPSTFLKNLRDIVEPFEVEFAYCAHPSTYFGSHFIAQVENEFTQQGADCCVIQTQGLLLPEFWYESEVEHTTEIFGPHSLATTTDFECAYKELSYILNPARLLSFYVWRRTALLELCQTLAAKNFKTMPQLARALFESIQPIALRYRDQLKTTPLVIAEKPRSMESSLGIAQQLLGQGQFKKTHRILNHVEQTFGHSPQLTFLRTCSNAAERNLWESRIELKRQLQVTPDQPELLNLLSSINNGLPESGFSYAQIHGAVNSVEGFMIPGQEEFLFNIVRQLPDNATIVEIGSHQGRSTVAMAFACFGTRKHIFAIDPWDGGSGVKDIFEHNLKRLGLSEYVTPLVGFSDQILKQWDNRPSIDFIFIDGSHTYPDVTQDFCLAYPLVKENGLIAFHDLAPSSVGPWRLWRELASHVLSEHSFCASLACGRKTAAFPQLPAPKPYSYSEDFIQYMSELAPYETSLIKALQLSKTTLTDKSMIQNIEREIARMPEEWKLILAAFVQEPSMNDGCLRYWNTLTLERDKKYHEAFVELRNFMKSPFPVHTPRMKIIKERILAQEQAAIAQHIETLKALQ